MCGRGDMVGEKGGMVHLHLSQHIPRLCDLPRLHRLTADAGIRRGMDEGMQG